MFYLTTHSTQFIYSYMVKDHYCSSVYTTVFSDYRSLCFEVSISYLPTLPLHAVAYRFLHCSTAYHISGVITPNQIPLRTIITYLQKRLQKQNFKPLGHYTCMQCGTSHLQTVQENILSYIIFTTYRKFTVATIRFTQNVSCNIYTQPIYQQVENVTV